MQLHRRDKKEYVSLKRRLTTPKKTQKEIVLEQLIKRGENLHCHHNKIMENNKQFSLATLSINSLSSPAKDID